MTFTVRILLTALASLAVAGAAPVLAQQPVQPAAAVTSTTALAQAPGAPADPATSGSGASTAQPEDDPDLDPNPAQPDFTLASLPTSLRLPRNKMSFRLTHRFTRPLGAGSFGNLVEDLFGLDSGAVIGLDFRYGLIKGGQIGVYRTADKTIQLYGQYEVIPKDAFPVAVSVFASIDGTDNFKDSYSPGILAVISRELGEHGALYLEPGWVNNTNAEPSELVDDNDTFLMGMGARLRIRNNTYVFVEGSPRISGYGPGDALISFGIEQRAGGHMFQLNFSNGFGTTLAQVARGASSNNDWYLGFNLSRKFF